MKDPGPTFFCLAVVVIAVVAISAGLVARALDLDPALALTIGACVGLPTSLLAAYWTTK